MKKLISGLVLTIFVAATVHAGVATPLGSGVTVEDLGDGTTLVDGNMTAVRFSDDTVQTIGCRVRAVSGGGQNIVCNARDINENSYFCFSFDPSLIDTAHSISPFSFIRFIFDNTTSECVDLLISVRSHHIPDEETQDWEADDDSDSDSDSD